MKTETSIQALEYVEASGDALGAAQKLAEKVAEEGRKVAEVVPQAVDDV